MHCTRTGAISPSGAVGSCDEGTARCYKGALTLLRRHRMRKVIALALCCFASGAYAQVGGGVVGSLGANGAVSRFGGLGTGITSGATMRGEDLRQTGQLSAETRTAGTTAGTNAPPSRNAAAAIHPNAKPGPAHTPLNPAPR